MLLVIGLFIGRAKRGGTKSVCGVSTDSYAVQVQERLDEDPYFKRRKGSDHLVSCGTLVCGGQSYVYAEILTFSHLL